jgi:putative intracellular protease/amidase
MRIKPINVLIFVLLVATALAAQAEHKGRILMVASNQLDMGDPEQHDARNNLWEYAPPYHVFVAHGYEVDFVSPSGGAVPFMMEPLGISSYTIKYEGFLDKANNSLQPSEVDIKAYQAVYVGGGYGTMFDVAFDQDMLNIIAGIYEQGGVLGSCGHGAGVFAQVKLSNGEYLVNGKRVAGFPDSTEQEKSWAKQGTLLPFTVESRLRESGALVVNKSNIADKHDVVTDQRIVSSMFLPSAALVAKEMLPSTRSAELNSQH